MAIDVMTEPGKTLKRLADKLQARQQRIGKLEKWLDGNAPIPDAPAAYKYAYRRLQEMARFNLAPIVVQAVKQRMNPVGFLVGDDSAADKTSWYWWSVNEMKRGAAEVHGDMLGLVWGYTIVGEPDEDGVPVITREDPRQCITEHDPWRSTRVTAALKMYRDDLREKDYAYLYLPGYVLIASRPVGLVDVPDYDVAGYSWDDSEYSDGIYKLSVPGIVPVTCFENDGPVAGKPMAEFEPHLSALRRVHETTLHRLVDTYTQAFRQRAILGELPETDPSTGEAIDYAEMFIPGAAKLWLTNAPAEGPDAVKFWESQTTDITPLLTAVKDDLRVFAAETATPLSMLMPDAQNQSAEGALSTKESLITKAIERQAAAGYGWNRTMQLAWAFAGKRANVETLWAPAALVSLAEQADAYSKMADMPFETKLREVLQKTPDEIERIMRERMADAFGTFTPQALTTAQMQQQAGEMMTDGAGS